MGGLPLLHWRAHIVRKQRSTKGGREGGGFAHREEAPFMEVAWIGCHGAEDPPVQPQAVVDHTTECNIRHVLEASRT